MQNVVEALDGFAAAVLHGKELRGEGARGGLYQIRQIEMVGTEADAEFPQRGAGILGKALHVVADPGAIENAEGFGDVEGKAARYAIEPLALFEISKRPEKLSDMLGKPKIEPPLDHCKRLAGQLFVRQNRHAWFEHMRAGADFAGRLAEPADDSVIGKDERFVDGLAHPPGAAFDFACQGLLRGGVQSLRGFASRLRVGREAKPIELANVLALDQHVPAWGDLGFQHGVLP